MADLQYGTSAYSRSRGNLPDLPVINMFVEDGPTEQQPLLQSRPGLNTNTGTYGTGNGKSVFCVDGVFGNTAYVLMSDNKLYNGGGTLLGTIDGNGSVSWAAYSNNLFINSGQSLWMWNGTTLSTVATPGSFVTTAICVAASHLVAISKDTGQFYWSDPLGTTIPSLNFATAEQSPDKLKDLLYMGDTLILFGTETVEFWPSTGDTNAPFAPLVGRTFPVGIRDTGCAELFNGGFAWVTNHHKVCFGDPKNVISDVGIEEKIAASTACALFSFWLEGTEFLAVDIDSDVYIYSAKSHQWSIFRSNGLSPLKWAACAYMRQNNVDYFANRYGNALCGWTTDHKDFGGPMVRTFRGGIPMTGEITFVNNILLRTNPGRTPYTNPTQYYNPTVSLKFSKDGGTTFSNTYVKSLGLNGEYRKLINWRSLGRFKFPSLLVEISVTDPVPFRVSGLKINEAYPN